MSVSHTLEISMFINRFPCKVVELARSDNSAVHATRSDPLSIVPRLQGQWYPEMTLSGAETSARLELGVTELQLPRQRAGFLL